MILIRGLFELSQCKVCGRKRVIIDDHKVCLDCISKLRKRSSYLEVNNEHRGFKRAQSWSIEFEVARTPLELGIVLLKSKYIPTDDISIGPGGTEWKSPIYHNCKIYMNDLQNIEPYIDSTVIDERCGTHIHVGIKHWQALLEKEQIIERVLQPLVSKLSEDPLETINIWGRFFNWYAGRRGFLSDHHNWLALSFRTCQTLEWRLPQYRNAKQYFAVTMFAIEASKLLDRVAIKVYSERERHAIHRIVEKAGKQLVERYEKLRKVAIECAV